MTPWTVVRIGEVSKVLTAVGVLRLVEMGKITLDQSVFGEKSWLEICFSLFFFIFLHSLRMFLFEVLIYANSDSDGCSSLNEHLTHSNGCFDWQKLTQIKREETKHHASNISLQELLLND